MDRNKDFILSEEMLIIKHSGEIPEVAYHGSLYYLTADQEGPQLSLDHNDLAQLKKMVVERYCEIIRRDLTPENRDKTIYRGLARCVANWHRLVKFGQKEKIDLETIRQDTAGRLRAFLEQEVNEVQKGTRGSSINCSKKTLADFAEELGLDSCL
ncbi:MAG: hypothetical protein KKB30_04670 [Proteobacteria bacterium]|nr:hypothetical protein [Pseudomonadota bacterium]MBU1715498.1 hypothetical protein [Pseudomonadota bacterium]